MKKRKLRETSQARYRSVLDSFLEYLEEKKKMPNAQISTISYAIASDYILYRSENESMPNGKKETVVASQNITK